ncbi:MAG: sugar phosphate isomerase/epimerase family protein [Bryobacteraceae bacterium]|nr:sugar phosphate isomerase/epimerase family protein [Bryobacteraceae bacterium]
MSAIARRIMLKTIACAVAAPAAQTGPRRIALHLTPGSIGVKADQRETIDLAARFGFEAVEPYAAYLAQLPEADFSRLLDYLRSRNLVFGNAGLTVEFRRSDEDFRQGIAPFPDICRRLRAANVTRVTTWISPAHDTLTFLQNMRRHAARLREVATILGDNGQRLGLEYVGPKTLWTSRRYPFVHSMAEMRDLIGEIGRPNVGFVMDSWHWYTAGEGQAELLTLKKEEVVSLDLNDAPSGIPVDQQIDSARELPMATGVIDMKLFLNTLHQIGCDAPARCEPFNAKLRAMPRDEALAATAASMKKALALIG